MLLIAIYIFTILSNKEKRGAERMSTGLMDFNPDFITLVLQFSVFSVH